VFKISLTDIHKPNVPNSIISFLNLIADNIVYKTGRKLTIPGEQRTRISCNMNIIV